MTLAQARDLVDTDLGNTGLHERRPVVAVESIPACAGEPYSGIWCRSPSAVYPRAYGATQAALCRQYCHNAHSEQRRAAGKLRRVRRRGVGRRVVKLKAALPVHRVLNVLLEPNQKDYIGSRLTYQLPQHAAHLSLRTTIDNDSARTARSVVGNDNRLAFRSRSFPHFACTCCRTGNNCPLCYDYRLPARRQQSA